MPVTIVVRTENEAEKALTFDGERVVIGRGQGSDVRSTSVREGSLEITRVPCLQRVEFQSQTSGGKLHLLPVDGGATTPRIPHHGYPREIGNNFLEQLKPLSGQFRRNLGQPGQVAARAGKARYHPHHNRVGV